MTLHINDAGTWRQIQSVHVNDNGTWREIQEIYVNDSGTWRSVFVNDVISISSYSTSVSASGGGPTATYRLSSAGDIEATAAVTSSSTVSDQGDWITPKANMAAYEVRATLTGGDALTSGTTGAWQSLGTTRSWTQQAVVSGDNFTSTLLIEIRRASDAVVLDSAVITLNAERF